MMTKLAENIELSKEHTKNLTETIQTMIAGLETHGPHNTIDPASHLNEIKKKTNRTMPSTTPPPGSGYRLVNSTHCEVCGSVFFSPKALQNHMNKHHPNYRGGPAGSGYNCEICGQQFAHLGLLQFHRGKYHPDYLARESGRIRPSSPAINNLQLFTSTQAASQHSQSQLPPLQRQNAPHNGHSLSVVRRKTAPNRAKITTKIYPSATVIQNLSKKQHTKSFVPTSENQ